MIDLNGIKVINDSLGHDVGDLLLQHNAIASVTLSARRTSWRASGGDEFIIIASNLPAAPPVKQIADASRSRISEALRKPFSSGGHNLIVSGSVGVSVYPDDTKDEVLLRRLADQRMYEQKRQIPLEFEVATAQSGASAIQV